MKYKFCIMLIILFSVIVFGCNKKKDERSSLLNWLAFDAIMKTDAAIKTAENNCNCQRIQPFYWEIGNGNGKIVSASIPDATKYDESSPMYIASASKWLWGAYVLERLKKDSNIQPGDNEKFYLRMHSGYTNLNDLLCIADTTVHDCFNNGTPDPSTVNKFFYESGHFQAYAVLILQNLNDMKAEALTNEILDYLGHDIGFSYKTTLLAGGGYCSPAAYRVFLKKILNRNLAISDYLGVDAVCAQPLNCPLDAVSTPLPDTISWDYSYSHWVENDPKTGDGSFSSPGLFGFYPWINHDKNLYGIVAREVITINSDVYINSVYCGSLIRKAYETGVEQTHLCY